jgi:hypothetical protein
MYNKEIKEKFINEHYNTEESKKVVECAFNNYSKIEEQYDTDLYHFNFYQRNELLMNLSSSSIKAIRKDYNYIQSYVRWAENRGMCPLNMAFIDLSTNELKQFVSNAKKDQFIKNREELYNNFLPKIHNVIDKAMIILIYEGVLGKEAVDLVNFTKENIEFDKQRFIFNTKKGTRIIPNIDQQSIDILKKSISETIYELDNGNSNAKAPTRNLANSDYIVRPIIGFEDKINRMGVITKFSKIKIWTEKRYIKPKSIHYSGMFDKLRNIEISEKRDLVTYDYEDVLTLYGYNAKQSAHLKLDYEYFCEMFYGE